MGLFFSTASMSESPTASAEVAEQTPAPVQDTEPQTESESPKSVPASSPDPASESSAPVVEQQETTQTEAPSSYDLPLETQWSFWYSTKPAPDEKYESKLRKLGSFQSLQGFKDIYTHLESPSELPKDSNYSLFRNTHKPMWETFPHGGCWNLHLTKNTHELPQLWEKLVLAAIGEAFRHTTMVGIAVSRRAKEDVLSVWLRSPKKSVRFEIGSVIKEVLDSPSITIEYKDHQSSIKDRSTYHNGKFYTGGAPKGRKSQKERRRKSDKKPSEDNNSQESAPAADQASASPSPAEAQSPESSSTTPATSAAE